MPTVEGFWREGIDIGEMVAAKTGKTACLFFLPNGWI